MILKNYDYEKFLNNPNKNIKAILFYGANDGLAAERFDEVSKVIVGDINNPFRVINLAIEDLENDKSRLLTEVSSLSFTGESKIIRIKNVGNSSSSYFQDLLNTNNDSLVILSAGELKPKSALRKLFEENSQLAIVPCYIDDISDIAGIIQNTISKNGYSISSDALSFVASHLGADRKIIFSELEKLCLYMGSKKEITISEVKECIGDSASLTMEDLCYAVSEGKHEASIRILENIFAEGISPVAVVRVLSSHFQKIYLTCDKVAQGLSVDNAIKTLKPPIMFKKMPSFHRIIEHWNSANSAKAISLLFNAEIEIKTTAYPQEIICAKTIAQITGAGYEIMKRKF